MPGTRETTRPGPGDKRYVRRDARGRFTSSQDNVSRSLRQDTRQRAKTATKSGQGDRGDRRSGGKR